MKAVFLNLLFCVHVLFTIHQTAVNESFVFRNNTEQTTFSIIVKEHSLISRNPQCFAWGGGGYFLRMCQQWESPTLAVHLVVQTAGKKDQIHKELCPRKSHGLSQ